MAKDEIEFFRALSPETRGLFFAVMAIVTVAINEKALNRERLIDYLLDVLAGRELLGGQAAEMSPFLEMAVRFLEGTQFP